MVKETKKETLKGQVIDSNIPKIGKIPLHTYVSAGYTWCIIDSKAVLASETIGKEVEYIVTLTGLAHIVRILR